MTEQTSKPIIDIYLEHMKPLIREQAIMHEAMDLAARHAAKQIVELLENECVYRIVPINDTQQTCMCIPFPAWQALKELVKEK